MTGLSSQLAVVLIWYDFCRGDIRMDNFNNRGVFKRKYYDLNGNHVSILCSTSVLPIMSGKMK